MANRTSQIGRGQIGAAQIGSSAVAGGGATSFTIAPSSGHALGAVSITATGSGTLWSGSSQFSITGGTGIGSLSAQSGTNTSYTFTLTVTGRGTFIISDGATTQTYNGSAVAPLAPTIGTATNNHNGTASITFTPNADNGGSTVTGATATGSLGDNGTSAGSSPITVTVASGNRGVNQTWTVTQSNIVGTGSASGPTSAIQVTSPPGVPTIGSASAGNASATVSFTPGITGGLSITYVATSTPGSFTGSGSSSPVTVSGLSNGTSYTFTVHATNTDGTSAESGPTGSVTPSAVLTMVFDAPYVSGDILPGTPTYQPYTIVSGVLTALGSAITTGFNAVPNVPNGYRCVLQKAANGSFGDFAGLGVFTGINTTVNRAVAINSPAVTPPSSNVTCEIAPFRPSDTLGTVVAQTLTLSASTVGTGRTATAGASTFAGNSTDVGKYIYSGSGRAIITAASSVTVCTVQIIDAFAGTSISSSAWSWGSVGYTNNVISGLTISQSGGLVTTNIYAIPGIVNGFVALRSDTPDANHGSVVPADWQG